jgi:hypothetical protein
MPRRPIRPCHLQRSGSPTQSAKEYVIKASSAKKVGRGFLDWVNAGAPGYAEGGGVVPWTDDAYWEKAEKFERDDPDIEAERNTYLFHHPLGEYEKKPPPISADAIIASPRVSAAAPRLTESIIRRDHRSCRIRWWRRRSLRR